MDLLWYYVKTKGDMIVKLLIYGSGFITRNLIEYFKFFDKNVQILLIYNNHKLEEFENVKQLSIKENIEDVLLQEKPEYIIILQGNSFVSNNTSIESSTKDNMLKSAIFLEKVYELDVSKFIKKILVVGSASEYGKFYDKPILEDFALHPTSLYGLSKIFLYNASMYFVERGLPIVYIRQFNTVGVGQRDNFVFSFFSKNIIKIEKGLEEPILNVGDLSQERDFLDVRDTCLAYHMLMQKGVIGETYNVASGEYISIGKLLHLMIEKSDLSIDDLKIIENKNLFSKEASLSRRLHADIDKLKKLGFKPKYHLENTIIDILEHWRKNVR